MYHSTKLDRESLRNDKTEYLGICTDHERIYVSNLYITSKGPHSSLTGQVVTQHTCSLLRFASVSILRLPKPCVPPAAVNALPEGTIEHKREANSIQQSVLFILFKFLNKPLLTDCFGLL